MYKQILETIHFRVLVCFFLFQKERPFSCESVELTRKNGDEKEG
jgi:hypothetical protein